VPLQKTRRVSRRAPCEVCKHADWCLVAHDGRYAVCMRVLSDRPARGGGYLHFQDQAFTAAAPSDFEPAPSCPLAPPDRRHRVYGRLLQAAPLTLAHGQLLEGRGFTPADIAARGYASLQLRRRAALARACYAGSPEEVIGIPGLFRKVAYVGRTYWSVAGRPGLLLPCRDSQGRIRALSIRPDEPNGPKYVWLSSNHRPGGTGSGAPCHVARPLQVAKPTTPLWITEGIFKADLASFRLQVTVLALPGVGNWATALLDVAELVQPGGQVVLALDADWRTNVAVHEALWGLALSLQALGYAVEVALWEPTHKGLDDLLTVGLEPVLNPPSAIPPSLWHPRLSSRTLALVPKGTPAETVTVDTMRRLLAAALAEPPSLWSA
jgi:hypothetical protein